MILHLVAALALGWPTDRLPVRSPTSVGMSPERLEIIDRVVREGIRAGGFPGAAVVIGRQGAAVWRKGFGTLGWGVESPAVTTDGTIYDLASLTKVVATTTAAMILYDEGKLSLDAKVADYIPAFTGKWKDEVTVRHLLTHRSGLPAGRDLWRVTRTADEARQAVIDTPLNARPGRYFEYSDLGADMLGLVVEALAGLPLDVFVRQRVFEPLGMRDTFFTPPDSVRDRAAPTEVTPPRGYPLQGQVHDENAYALGGVAGHAGLFGTADDLAVFAQMMLNGGIYEGARIVSDSAVRLFTQRAAGSRALGWEMAEGRHGAGEYLSPTAYGHVGFTGTSLWIDPQRNMFVILLTNRVHAARARRPATVIADVRADLADAAALAVTDEELRISVMPAAFRADRAVNWNKPLRSRRSRYKRSRSRTSSANTAAAKKAAAAKGSSASKAKASAKTSAAKSSAAKSKAGAAAASAAAKSKASASSTTAKGRVSSATKAKPAAKARATTKAKPATKTTAKTTAKKPSAKKPSAKPRF
ncbi:MAG: serine hydrolase [Gemmatimonadota bacterium]|nr:serine hydrolase [Gemmatimonadota bacterium]